VAIATSLPPITSGLGNNKVENMRTNRQSIPIRNFPPSLRIQPITRFCPTHPLRRLSRLDRGSAWHLWAASGPKKLDLGAAKRRRVCPTQSVYMLIVRCQIGYAQYAQETDGIFGEGEAGVEGKRLTNSAFSKVALITTRLTK